MYEQGTGSPWGWKERWSKFARLTQGDGGRARPFVSVHLHLCLQLGLSLIHINMWRRHQWLQPLAPAVTCHHRRTGSHWCSRREKFRVRNRGRTLWSLGDGKRDWHWEEMSCRVNLMLGDRILLCWLSRGQCITSKGWSDLNDVEILICQAYSSMAALSSYSLAHEDPVSHHTTALRTPLAFVGVTALLSFPSSLSSEGGFPTVFFASSLHLLLQKHSFKQGLTGPEPTLVAPNKS